MADHSQNSGLQRFFFATGSLVLVVTALYFAQKVIIPLALAVLLSFILTPLVTALQRRGLGRMPAVMLVLLLTGTLFGFLGWAMSAELRELANTLPKHRHNISEKIIQLRSTSDGVIGKFLQTIHDITEDVQKTEVEAAGPPQPVVIANQSSGLSWLSMIFTPLTETLATILFIVILVIFMLLRREDMRDRVIHVIGRGRLTVTTRAVDEAGQRISGYLLTQLVINSGFGVVLTVGLWLIGVPYAPLWGILAGALRFIPYIGIWVAAGLPCLLTLAVFPGWHELLLVIGLFLLLEFITFNLVEPLLFSHSTGVSPVALLVAAVFWTWLWGPIGLVLSTPMTVCLAVLGKYVPALGVFHVLLGGEKSLAPDVSYYQRLLARDEDEASDLVEDYLSDHSADQVYDDVLLPALLLARRDEERGDLTAEDRETILRVTSGVLDNVVAAQQQIRMIASGKARVSETGEPAPVPPRAFLLGCPARDELDEITLRMLGQLLEGDACHVEVLSPHTLTSEVLKKVSDQHPAAVCVGSLLPGGLAQARYLCKRLRAQSEDLKIVVGRWGQKENLEKTQERLRSAGANYVTTSLLDCRNHVLPLIQVAANGKSLPKRPAPEMAAS